MGISVHMLLTTIALSILLTPVRSIGGMCAQIVYGNFYDLGDLESEIDYSLDIINARGRIIFNMCKFVSLRCPGYNDSLAIYRTEDLCVPLTSNSQTSDYNSTLLPTVNGTNNTAGLNITFPGIVKVDPSLGNSSTNYSLQLLLSCDSNITEYIWDNPLPSFTTYKS